MDQQTEQTTTGITFAPSWTDAADASSDEQARQRLAERFPTRKVTKSIEVDLTDAEIANALAKTVAIVRDGAPVAEWRSLDEMAMSVAPGPTYARRRDATRAISAGKRGVS